MLGYFKVKNSWCLLLTLPELFSDVCLGRVSSRFTAEMFAKTVGIMWDSLLLLGSFLEIVFCVMLIKHLFLKRRRKIPYISWQVHCFELITTWRDPYMDLSWRHCLLGATSITKTWVVAITGVSACEKRRINVQANLNIHHHFFFVKNAS